MYRYFKFILSIIFIDLYVHLISSWKILQWFPISFRRIEVFLLSSTVLSLMTIFFCIFCVHLLILHSFQVHSYLPPYISRWIHSNVCNLFLPFLSWSAHIAMLCFTNSYIISCSLLLKDFISQVALFFQFVNFFLWWIIIFNSVLFLCKIAVLCVVCCFIISRALTWTKNPSSLFRLETGSSDYHATQSTWQPTSGGVEKT